MISRYAHKELTWIDAESPTAEEVALLSEEYNLHPVAAHELLEPSDRTKADVYENAIYIVLHFPIWNAAGRIDEAEIDFILLKNALITAHYELIDPLRDFAKLFELDGYLENSKLGPHTGFLFFSIMRELYKHTQFLVDSLSRDIRSIEKHIFTGEEPAMVERISTTNRILIDIRQSLRSHKETINSFASTGVQLYCEDFGYYSNMILGEYGHIEQAIEENHLMLLDLRRTNDSLLSAKTNATIRKLTVVNVIMLPLGLVSWIFAMHSQFLYLDEPWQLAAVLGGMALICLVSILYFRSKKWL